MAKVLAVSLLLATVAAVAAETPLLVGLRQRNLDQLEDVFWKVADPTSGMYGKHLSASQIGAIIGATETDVRTVSEWLVANGASPNVELLATGDYLVARFHDKSQALRVMRTATTALPALVEIVTRADPDALSLPADLEVAAAKHAAVRRAQSTESPVSTSSTRSFKPSPLAFGDPNSQRQAYGIPTSERGSSPKNRQMVWGPGTYGFLDSDLQSFYTDLKVNETTSLLTHLGNKGVPGGDNFGEATLDVSYISGIGQGIPTLVYNSNSSMSTEEGDGFGAALLHFAASLATGSAPAMPVTLSISLGSLTYTSCHMLCEDASSASGGSVSFKQCWAYMQQQRQVCMFLGQDQITRTSTEFMKVGLRGVTVLAAAGDGGSHYSFQPFPNDQIGSLLNTAACAKNFPTYPASDPYVTGVGGTTWNGAPTAPTPWGGSGGGFSWTFKMPAYQQSFVEAYLKGANMPPSTAFAAGNRAYPDVAALATGIPMVLDGQFVVSGGTSASAPEFSGLISLINDRRLSAGLSPLGFLNTRLYQLAASHQSEAFYTMATGTSACTSAGTCCPTSTSFPAAEAWDPITGLGSPLWPGLLKYLSSDSQL